MGLFENFPYTNFHRTNLDWFLKTFKDLLAEWDETQTQFADLNEAFDALSRYVHEHLDDIPAEVNRVIQEMVDSGEFEQIIEPYIDVVIDSKVSYFPTNSDLIAANIGLGIFAKTGGYYAEGDGGGAYYTIVDTAPTGEYYLTLTNGYFAKLYNDGHIVLPRYGGAYVNEMVDNARPYITWYQRNKIILPVPNAAHPGCGHYSKTVDGETRNVYFWKCNDPIVIDEHFSYSDIYLNGEVAAVSDIEAVLKISDANKPEDINFISPVRVGGTRAGGLTSTPDSAILIEGCARVIFSSCVQAGWSKNAVTLGGPNANNTIEFFAFIMEIGSCTEKAFCVDNSLTTFFDITNLRVQNLLNPGCDVIYINGNVFESHIGTMLITPGVNTSTNTIYCKSTTQHATDNVLSIDTCRITGLGIEFEKGLYNIGSLSWSASATPSNNVIKVNAGTTVDCKNASTFGIGWTANVNATGLLRIDNVDATVSVVGSNVFLGGITSNADPAVAKDGLMFDPSTQTLSIFQSGAVSGSGTLREVTLVSAGTLASNATETFSLSAYAGDKYAMIGFMVGNEYVQTRSDYFSAVVFNTTSGNLTVVRQNPSVYSGSQIFVLLMRVA